MNKRFFKIISVLRINGKMFFLYASQLYDLPKDEQHRYKARLVSFEIKRNPCRQIKFSHLRPDLRKRTDNNNSQSILEKFHTESSHVYLHVPIFFTELLTLASGVSLRLKD